MKKQAALHYIHTHNLTGLKAGKERVNFLEIWMVVVENRIFARSWGFAEKSWYNTFLQDEQGQLKCGTEVYDIKARIPADLERLTPAINQAYLDKYNSGENAFYARGIVEPQHIEKTMEFVLL
ncbi:MAG: DUF2255 family protein [Bacteroidia bacterium]|nr:DUF2255 family protein [Bacteroidia bacterium]